MTHLSRSILNIWLCLSVALAAPTQGVVLCFGEDGHVAMEKAHANRPCGGCADAHGIAPAESEAPVSPSNWTTPNLGGCACLDFSVSGSQLNSVRSVKTFDHAPPPADPFFVADEMASREFELARRGQSLIAARGVALPSPLSHLRSVILTI